MAYARNFSTGIPRLLVRPSRAVRARVVFAVLLAFALRASIPLGFMPASDGSLALVICPGGFPAALLPRKSVQMAGGMAMPMSGGTQMPAEHHGHGLMDEGYCVFTTGLSSAPPPLLPTALFLLLASVTVVAVTVLAPAGIRLVHLPQARAPPVPF